MNQNDLARIQRTGLTPGTATDFAGVSIATENARRRAENIPELNPKQAEARLRLFKQQAGTPGSEIKDQFAEIQKSQRQQRESTLVGRFHNAGLSALNRIGEAGFSIAGLAAPETANALSDEFNTLLNPNEESRSGRAGGFAGEAAKTLAFAKAGPAGLAALFGAQGAGGVRRESAELRDQGVDISLKQELATAAGVGGVEAVSGFITGKIFGNLGNIARTSTPAFKTAIAQGNQSAVREWVRQGLSVFGNMIVEGGEEGLTQLITNKIKKEGINPGQAVTDGILESIITGALLSPLGGGAAQVSQSAADGPSESPTGQTILTKLQQRREAAKQQNLEGTATKAAPQGDTEQAAADVETSKAEAQARQEATIRNMLPGEADATIQRLLGRQTDPAPSELNAETATESQDAVEEAVGEVRSSETPIETIERVAGQRSPDGTTSARIVDLDSNREAMNNLLIEKEDVRTWQEALTTAQELEVPSRAVEVAQSVLLDPRPMTDVETAGVVQRVAATIQEHDTLAATIEQTESETDRALLAAELVRLEETHDVLTRGLRASGSEKGRALNAQKLTLNRNFELVSVLARARSAKQKDLTPREREQITTLTRQIKALQARLDRLENQPESESPTLNRARNAEIDTLRFQKSVLQSKVNRKIDNMKPRSILESMVSEPLSIMRAIKSSIDVSAVGRQAGLASLGNPARAIKNLRPMFKALASERAQFEINEQLKNRPNFELYRLAGLRITDTDQGATLTDKEENYRSRFADHIPGIRASDRAFSTFLNLMRADGFDAMTKSLARNGEPTMDEAKVVAQVVNNFTGFGGLANQRASAQILNSVFWSPSLQLSRMQVLTGSSFRKGLQTSPRVSKLVAKEYAKTLLGFGTLLALGLLAGFEVERDPTSSDFLKLRMGNTRIDLGAGLMQYVVLVNKIVQGQTKSPVTGRITELRGKDKAFFRSLGGEVGRFGRSKLTPGLGLGVDIALFNFKNVVGQDIREPISPAAIGAEVVGANTEVDTIEGTKNIVLNNIVPLSVGEVFESMQEQGIGKGAALGLLSIFGVGVQNFGKKKKI
jgi:hypothetical protein